MSRMSVLAGESYNIARVAVKKLMEGVRKPSASIKVGDKIPDVRLYEDDHTKVVSLAKICANKLVVLFGVPGAFTPGCSKTHLPGYIRRAEELKNSGVSEIICVSVNDPFVMNAWAREHKAMGKVRMLSDPMGEFVRAVDLHTHLPFLGEIRSKRYSMIIDDGIVKSLNVEPDGIGLTCSLADKLKISDELKL